MKNYLSEKKKDYKNNYRLLFTLKIVETFLPSK